MSIKLNGKMIKESYSPKKAKTKIPLIFYKEVNKLTLKAITEGTEPPNTAQIRITDGNGKEISMLSSFKVGEQVEVVFYKKDIK
jgi:gamma-glutamyltranspeptidase